MNTRNKLVTLAAVAALATVASAASYSWMAGQLAPDRFRDHSYRVGRGYYTVDLENRSYGDLDAKVFAESGVMLGSDVLPDNNPIVWFYSDHPQTIKVRALNSSTNRWAQYSGTIEFERS